MSISLEEIMLVKFLFTSIISLLFAWILYHSADAGVGRWIRLLGWVFFTFFLIYILKALGLHIDPYKTYLNVLNQVLSTINNLLMFLAAKELLSGQIKLELNSEKNIFSSFLFQIKESIPLKFIVLAIVATIVSVSQPLLEMILKPNHTHFFVRLFDGAFSTVCFIYLGYAFWVNITVLQKKIIAILGFIPMIIYSITHLPYIVFPLIFDESSLADFVLFTVSLGLKIAIFVTAYYLGMKILEVATETRRITEDVINTRKNFLSNSGILESIGKVLKANSVTLFIKVPSRNVTEVRKIEWNKNQAENDNDENNGLCDISDYPKVAEIFGKESNKPVEINFDFLVTFFSPKNEELAKKYFPIIYNGAVIGCLELELNKLASITSVVNHQIDRFVKGLLISVQDYRENLSLKQATYQCASFEFGREILNSSDVIEKIAYVIDDILAPEGLRIVGNIGFKRIDYAKATDTDYKKVSETSKINILNSFPDSFSNTLDKITKDKLINDLNLLPLEADMELPVNNNDTFGKLFLLVKAAKDSINSPTLGIYPMNRNAIATIISNAFCDLMREYLNRNLTGLGLNLSKETLSINQWFQEIEFVAKNVELLWFVATSPDSENDFLGNEKHIKIVKDNWDKVEKGSECDLFSYPITEIENTSHIITLRLKNTQQTFWFGVENPNFGFEFSFDSPWKMFLEHLADIADVTLIKINAQEKQLQSVRFHVLATMATRGANFIHQLVSLSKNAEAGFKDIYYAILSGELKVINSSDEERNLKELNLKTVSEKLKDSGNEMLELTEAFREITQISEERPCSLFDSIEKTRNLYSLALMKNEILVNVNYEQTDFKVDIPLQTISGALANLISNSIDALKDFKTELKKITIIVKQENNKVSCFFIDNGPGIPETIKSEIGSLGKTGKPDGSGWGLYLSKQLLNDHNGDLELINSVCGHTEFKITLPLENK